MPCIFDILNISCKTKSSLNIDSSTTEISKQSAAKKYNFKSLFSKRRKQKNIVITNNCTSNPKVALDELKTAIANKMDLKCFDDKLEAPDVLDDNGEREEGEKMGLICKDPATNVHSISYKVTTVPTSHTSKLQDKHTVVNGDSPGSSTKIKRFKFFSNPFFNLVQRRDKNVTNLSHPAPVVASPDNTCHVSGLGVALKTVPVASVPYTLPRPPSSTPTARIYVSPIKSCRYYGTSTFKKPLALSNRCPVLQPPPLSPPTLDNTYDLPVVDNYDSGLFMPLPSLDTSGGAGPEEEHYDLPWDMATATRSSGPYGSGRGALVCGVARSDPPVVADTRPTDEYNAPWSELLTLTTPTKIPIPTGGASASSLALRGTIGQGAGFRVRKRAPLPPADLGLPLRVEDDNEEGGSSIHSKIKLFESRTRQTSSNPKGSDLTNASKYNSMSRCSYLRIRAGPDDQRLTLTIEQPSPPGKRRKPRPPHASRRMIDVGGDLARVPDWVSRPPALAPSLMSQSLDREALANLA